jgi:hypothetical protein
VDLKPQPGHTPKLSSEGRSQGSTWRDHLETPSRSEHAESEWCEHHKQTAGQAGDSVAEGRFDARLCERLCGN